MSDRLTVACVQVTAGPDPEPNLEVVEALIREARSAGADLIITYWAPAMARWLSE